MPFQLVKLVYACVCAVALCPLSALAADLPTATDKALRQLDAVVARQQQYVDARQRHIDSLISVSDSSSSSLLLIGDAYRKFCVDSALHYYDIAQAGASDVDALRARLRFSSLLPVSGNVADGVRIFESIPAAAVSEDMKQEYHEAANQLYFYASSLTPELSDKNLYAARALAHTDTLLQLLPPGSDDYLLYSAERHIMMRDGAQAVADLTELLNGTQVSDPRFALAASMMAYHWADGKHRDKEKTYLALAAMSDLYNGTREMTALQSLGKMLFDDGDTERAFRYLNLALDITLDSGSRLRIADAASALPLIAETMHQKSEFKNGVLLALVCLLAALVGAICVLMWKMYASHRKLDENADQLKASLAERENYIRHVLALCSECIDRLEDFNLIALRKIKAKQVNELYEMVQSRKIVHDQHQKFLNTFDATFLSIYPNFIDEVNELLQPDKKLAPSNVHSLSPELRILAMMRLGIDNVQTIAKLLDLSVNTVYTYRNKMKNRAIDRDNFEENVKGGH